MRSALFAIMLLTSTLWYGQIVRADSESATRENSKSVQILVLDSYQYGLPVPDGIDKGIISSFRKSKISIADVFVEKLDFSRIKDDEHRANTARLLRHKLAGRPIDIVFIVGFPAVDFLAGEGQKIIPDSALLITVATPNIMPLSGGPHKVINLPWDVDTLGTFKSALHLFPDTRRVVVVTGAHDTEMPFLDAAKKDLAPWKGTIDIEFTDVMSYSEMLGHVTANPSNTVIIYAPYFNDSTGRSFVPAEVARTIAQKANAPVFSLLDIYMGFGFVGGSLVKTERIGEQAAQAAIDYVVGRLHPVEPVTTLKMTSEMMFDWAALKRWNGDVDHLPEGSSIINRTLTLWDQYRNIVIAATSVIITLTVMVFLLAGQSHRRALAEATARLGEARFRVLIDQAPDAIVVYDVDRMRFVDANPRAEILFGCSRDELVQSDLFRFYSPTQSDGRAAVENVKTYFTQATVEQSLQFELKILSGKNAESVCDVHMILLPSKEGRLFRLSLVDISERKMAEQALADEVVRRKILIEQSRDGIVVIDQNGKVYEANKKYSEMLGYSPDEMLQLHVWDWDAKWTPEEVMNIIGSVDETGYFFETLQRRKDGSLLEVEVSSNGTLFSERKLVFCVCRDITERKMTERALRESEQRFRQLFEVAAVPLCLVSKEGILLNSNTRFTQTFGYSKEDVPTLEKWWYLAYPDPSYRRWVLETWNNSVNRAIDEQTEIEPREYRVTCKNGDIRTVVISGSIIGGSFLAAFFDITERKQAETERERMMAAIEQTSDIIVITDSDGIIQYVNPAFEAVTGYSREEAIGKNPRFLKSDQQEDSFYDQIWETLSSGKPWGGRIINKRKDGSLYTEEATISPVRDSKGSIVNYVASKRDITEQLRFEDQFQQALKMESVGRLAGGVAHDFNNMLGVILGYTEIALDEINPETTLHANLTEIYNAAHRSSELTRQLLAFARKQTIAPKALNLNTTVAGMIKMLHRIIGEDIELAWLPGLNLWTVKMDPTQIDQILVNLCVNARDAISGVGKITIQTGNSSLDATYCANHIGAVPGEYVMLAVSDNGCGIDRDAQKLLFEPFFTTKEIGKGTGLGLSTVYGIVKQNNGFLIVQSEVGRGSTFKIFIPRDRDASSETELSGASKSQHGKGETVLLVEDEPALLKMTRKILEKMGYTVVSATGPTDAIRVAGEFGGEIHLLMTDVVMPGMNGHELAQRLLTVRPRMKLLFMSGYTADVIAHQGKLAEGVHFIQKPFSTQDLAIHLQTTMDS